MTSFRVQDAASHRIDEIYRYTRDRWGNDQAEVYVTGLFSLKFPSNNDELFQ